MGKIMDANYLESAIRLFDYYKGLGEKAMAQMPDEKLFWQYNAESNNVAMIVQHLSGNMISRWTDFLTTDGEKDWRNRDIEFENDIKTREELYVKWDKGWQCLFDALKPLTSHDLQKIVYIRNEAHTVIDAINRQLVHYPYHIGQIIFIAKMVSDNDWKSLSIPRGKSETFNETKFSAGKR